MGPIKLGGVDLRPAPFVSASYEYEKSGPYIIGGVLNITLDGTIVGEDILQQINNINALQANNDCMDLTVGCEGGTEFIGGAGKITNLSINRSDNAPFMATYSITISLETVNGQPAVEPDAEFVSRYNLEDVAYLKQYSETISVTGDGTVIGYVDSELNISKSFVKATGQISVASSTTAVCGNPSFNGLDQSIDILQKRFNNLISFNLSDDHILRDYGGWNKWLDSKSITIDEDGTVSCSFDIYMTNGACNPIARIDVTTDDRIVDQQKHQIPNRTISGTISGMSAATTNILDNKCGVNERIGNAMTAWGILQGIITSGAWIGESVLVEEQEGNCATTKCPPPAANMCYQRLSSNVTLSPVAGEIVFSAEFGPIDSCSSNNYSIDTTVEEEYPAVRHREFIVPNTEKSIIQYMGDTPHKAVVTAKGSLKSCDKTQISGLTQCVISAYNSAAGPFAGWIRSSYVTNQGSSSYSITASFIKCG